LRSRVTAMLLVFLYQRRTEHYELAPEGQSINQDSSLLVLRRPWNAARREQEAGSSITTMRMLTQRCQLNCSWPNIQFLLFHNPPIHLTSPFPELKIAIKARRFRTLEDTTTNAANDLKATPQDP
jgi:hypothetical protein